MLRFSIVTPTLDRCAMLRAAIASLHGQRGPGFAVEHIVVDGGSRDGTIEMLQEIGGIRLLRDRGLGLYDAVNMGIAAARGDVVGLLNSDDLLADGALAALAAAFAAAPAADAACGAVELFGEGPARRLDDPRDLALDAHAALVGNCITNARFFRRSVFDRVGPFSTTYRRVADREFLARTLIAGIRTFAVPALVYRYRRHAGSLTFRAGAGATEEYREELLRLARAVGSMPGADQALSAKARALEGRCLAVMALRRLQRGAMAQAGHTLLRGGAGATTSPLRAIAAAVADLIAATAGRR